MREKLEKNYQLNLQNNNLQKSFIIDSFVGEGASCLVYNAKYIDELGIIRNVRIKELYPLEGCEKERKDTNIIWLSDEKKDYYVPYFENLYKRQIHFQNMANITNSSSQIIDNIYDANNTKYIILDCANGKTFDQYESNHLQNIFEVILSLTKLVKKYHDQGYLLLDIKPENFLTIDETNQLIKYLDFDSITSLYVIKNNNLAGLSCSLKYASPELIRGDIQKIDKCTDIYSIGAILYKKIFNLDVTSNERSIGFTPNYNNKYFININPKIYKKLTTFFRKTLSSNPKRRYQDCDEVFIDLQELIEISNPNSLSLLSTNIVQNNYFIGREKECSDIDEAFKNGKKVVFINGYGGIGKTELAKYYANSRSENYHTIIFGKCANGLKEVFENEDVFFIQNLRKYEISLEERIKCIQQLVDEDTLIVIDNLDVLNDPYFETLCSFNCKLLITTRAYLDGIISNTDTTQIISVDSMNLEDAYCLFTYYYKRDIEEDEKQAIFDLINHIEGFTLMIPILAKQMVTESILPSTMIEKLKNKRLKGISDSLIKHYKDHNLMNATAYDQVLGLYDIFELNHEEKEVLYIMSLLGNISISKRTLALFAGLFDKQLFNSNSMKKDFNGEITKLKDAGNVRDINSLIEKGYLEYDSTYDLVRCHNIIRELSLYEFHLSLLDTSIFHELFLIILTKIRDNHYESKSIDFKLNHSYDHNCLDKVYVNELTNLCFNIFDNIDFSNSRNQEIIAMNLLKHIIVSDKDYSKIIVKYQQNSFEPKIEYTLSCCEWIQDLCNGIVKKSLLEKLMEPLEIKQIDDLKYLEITSIFFDEIAIYSNLNILDDKILSKLQSFLSIYEERRILYLKNKDTKAHSFKQHNQLFERIENIIKNHQYEDELLHNSKNCLIRKASNLVEKERVDLKNIYSIVNDYQSKIEYKRSLYEVSDYCYKDIKEMKFEKTENDIEMPICLSLINQFITNEKIERSQFETYFGNFSAFAQMNENIYEYLSRKNDYMFMILQSKQFDILRNLKDFNVSEYLIYSYQMNTCVGKMLANLGEPSILLETLSIYLNNIITKENLSNKKYISWVDILMNTKNYAVNDFYNKCIEIGKKYHSPKLLQQIEKSKREIIGIDISYHDPELGMNCSVDYEIMWKRIQELLNKCIHAKEIDEIMNLRDEIMLENKITAFFKNKLLNCINPKITFFDALLIDRKYICQNYSSDIELLKELLEKEKKNSFEGVEEIINLLEICLQYSLLNNMDKVDEYFIKIEEYIKNNKEYNGQFDYLLFKLVYNFIEVLDKLGYCSVYESLIKFICNYWILHSIKKFNHFITAIIKDDLYCLLKKVPCHLVELSFTNKVIDEGLEPDEEIISRLDKIYLSTNINE